MADLFDDENLGILGRDWAIYDYNPVTNSYSPLDATTELKVGKGYWIIQYGSHFTDRTITLPNNSVPQQITTLARDQACLSERGCRSLSIDATASSTQWALLGNPFASQQVTNSMRVVTNGVTGPYNCADESGCTLEQANSSSILTSEFFTFYESYHVVGTHDSLQPWDGFWTLSRSKAYGTIPRLLIPQY